MLPSASIRVAPADFGAVRRVQLQVPCSEVVAWVLVRRGITDVVEARQLLEPYDATRAAARLHDPMLLGDMAAAVERIHFAIEQREPIVVHGDYDADGVCATTLLVEQLELLGAQVQAFLPDRFANGYGLQIDSVERFARSGCRLLIAVDCGITAIEPIAQARDRGIDVIVCDHHQPDSTAGSTRLPDAIICSTRPSDYPFPDLCATGVVGKLSQALGAPCGDMAHELEAIATVADCVPLVGENRVLVQRGLAAIRRSERPGLRALLSACELHPRDVAADDIAFRIAPHINAVGRLSQSERAYELLRAVDPDVAQRRAREVRETNIERRRIEGRITAEAIEQVEGWSDADRAARIYVVGGEGWHEGVVGIVASRLVERYSRPVVVLSGSEPLARGSGRSVDGVDLHAALGACDDLLVRWGGHQAAAGVTIEPSRIGDFRARLAKWADSNVAPELLTPHSTVDAVVAADDLELGLVEQLTALAPFGTANERPALMLIDVAVERAQGVGEGRHLRASLDVDGVRVPMISFGNGHLLPLVPDGTRVDVVAYASINRFRGSESLQLEVQRLVDVPQASPHEVVAGACGPSATLACASRRSAASIVADGLARTGIAPAEPERVALEPLLASPRTIDLRTGTHGIAHTVRLAMAGHTVVVAVADVPRRRVLLDGALHPRRLGVAGIVCIGDLCDEAIAATRLANTVAAADARPLLVLAEHAFVPQVVAALGGTAEVVVFDPPATDRQRDALIASGAPLHLTFGAANVRFARDVRAAELDVRGTFAGPYRRLRALAPAGSGRGIHGPELETALFGTDELALLHSPEALRIAVASLHARGLLAGWDDHGLQLCEPRPAPVASHS